MPAVIVAQQPAETETLRVEGEDVALRRLLEVSTTVLQQAVDLVQNDLASDDQLTVHSQYMPGSTIGEVQHRVHFD